MMFGHQDDQSNQFQMPQPADAASAANQPAPQVPSMPPPLAPSLGGPGGDDAWQHPGTPLESDPPAPATPPVQDNQDNPVDSVPDPQPDDGGHGTIDPDGTLNVQNNSQPADDFGNAQPQPQNPMPNANDLLDLKQQALTQLSPLVDHLDQTQTMLKTAYDAAQNITDEKVRAQALLDVINEINYFTQHQPKTQ
jgi:hypothetical protein